MVILLIPAPFIPTIEFVGTRMPAPFIPTIGYAALVVITDVAGPRCPSQANVDGILYCALVLRLAVLCPLLEYVDFVLFVVRLLDVVLLARAIFKVKIKIALSVNINEFIF